MWQIKKPWTLNLEMSFPSLKDQQPPLIYIYIYVTPRLVPEHGADGPEGSERLWWKLAKLDVTDRGPSCTLYHSRRRQQFVPIHLYGLELWPFPQHVWLHQLGIDCCTMWHSFTTWLCQWEQRHYTLQKMQQNIKLQFTTVYTWTRCMCACS